jgi:hypothetical protein
MLGLAWKNVVELLSPPPRATAGLYSTVRFVTRLQLLVSTIIYRLIEIVPTVPFEIVFTVPIEVVLIVSIKIVPTVPIEIVPTVPIENVPKVKHKKQLSYTKPTSRGGSDCHTGKP